MTERESSSVLIIELEDFEVGTLGMLTGLAFNVDLRMEAIWNNQNSDNKKTWIKIVIKGL